MAETRDDPRSKTNDPRVLLYSSIASVASGSAGAVATQLAAIDRSRLSEGDQQLLDAARAVAEKVIAIPNVPPAPAKVEEGDNTTAKVAPSHQDMPAGPATTKQAAPPAGPDATAMEASRKIVTDTRRKLAAIDELLKETE
jgi:chemotaxis protein MotC